MHPEDDNALNTDEKIWDLTQNINVKGGKQSVLPAHETDGADTGANYLQISLVRMQARHCRNAICKNAYDHRQEPRIALTPRIRYRTRPMSRKAFTLEDPSSTLLPSSERWELLLLRSHVSHLPSPWISVICTFPVVLTTPSLSRHDFQGRRFGHD